jgi:hypothetical protein
MNRRKNNRAARHQSLVSSELGNRSAQPVSVPNTTELSQCSETLSNTSSEFEFGKNTREMLVIHFNHVEQQVALAITTSALVVAANALILGGYITIAKEWQVFSKLGPVSGYFFFLSGVYLILGLLFSLLAVYPNIKSLTKNAPVIDIFFFGKVGSYSSFGQYLNEFDKCASENRLDQEMLFQVWGKSKFLRDVFKKVQCSVAFTMIGTGLGAIVLFVSCRYLNS